MKILQLLKTLIILHRPLYLSAQEPKERGSVKTKKTLISYRTHLDALNLSWMILVLILVIGLHSKAQSDDADTIVCRSITKRAVALAKTGNIMAAKNEKQFLVRSQCAQKFVDEVNKAIALAMDSQVQQETRGTSHVRSRNEAQAAMAAQMAAIEQKMIIEKKLKEELAMRKEKLAQEQALKRFEKAVPACANVSTDPSKITPEQLYECIVTCDNDNDKVLSSDKWYYESVVERFLVEGSKAGEQDAKLSIVVQRCLHRITTFGGMVIPGRKKEVTANNFAIELAQIWQKADRYVDISYCLDSCYLSPETQNVIEGIEGGKGYSQRIDNELRVVEKEIQNFTESSSYADYMSIRNRIEDISKQIDEKRKVIATNASILEKRLDRAKEGITDKAIGIAERNYKKAFQNIREATRIASSSEDMKSVLKDFNEVKEQLKKDRNIFNSKGDAIQNELSAVAAEFNDKTIKLEKAEERRDRIDSLKGDLCETYNQMKQLGEYVKSQKEVDQMSGTVNLYKRRQAAEGMLYLQQNITKLSKELKALGVKFSYKKDCY